MVIKGCPPSSAAKGYGYDYHQDGPYSMFFNWLSGRGGSADGSPWVFTQDDPLTQQLMNDPHNRELLAQLAHDGATLKVGKTYKSYYDDSGIGNLIPDSIAALSFGHLGSRPPVDAFLGSYTEKYTVVAKDFKTATVTVKFHVENHSDMNSLAHSFTANCQCDRSIGPGATIVEVFEWQQTFEWPHYSSRP